MKRKFYFIVSSIIQIFIAIYLMVNANSLVKTSIESVRETYKMFPVEFQDRVIDVFENIGSYYFIITSLICIILNLIILFCTISKKFISKKNLLIILSAICFFVSGSIISIVLLIINLIILIQIKEKDINKANNDNKIENLNNINNTIPTIKYEEASKKDIIFSIILLIIYFSQFIWSDLIPNNNSLLAGYIVITFYITIFTLSIVFFSDKLRKDFKLLKENFKAYFKYTAPKYGLMLISFIIVNLICILVTKKTTSINQQQLESISKPFLILLGVIWAPFVEETLFRGVFRRFIKNNYLFIIVSGLVFGVLHAINEETLINMIFTTLPYATLGAYLAYIYTKTNNLVNNILLHATWNLIAVTISLLTMVII